MTHRTHAQRRWSMFGRGALVSFAAGATVLLAAPMAVADPPPSPTAEAQVVPREGESTQLPDVRNWTWLVADADSGDVLAGRDWHWHLPPASTLKTLTALALVKRLDLNSTYRAQQNEANAEGSKVGIKAGSRYSVRDLFNGMLMPSGNDAALAVANAYGGVDRTVEAMNAELERLGAKDTTVRNTSGLDDPEQFSSAYDLALIMRESLKDPTLAEIYKQHDVQFPGEEPADPSQERKSYTIWTENRPILNYYPGALGGKTGFTSQAGRTYVGAFERNGRHLIIVVMRSAESTERAVERIADWGFDNIDKVEPIDHLVDAQPAPADITAQQAVSYDEGVSNLETVRTDSGETSAGISPTVLLFVLGGVAAVIVLIRRRRPARPTAGPTEVDVRDRENTPLR